MDSLFRHQPVDTSTEMFECVWVNGSFLFYRPNQPHSDGGLIFITTSSNTRPFHGIPQTGWMTLDSWRRETNFRGELKQTKRKKKQKTPHYRTTLFWRSLKYFFVFHPLGEKKKKPPRDKTSRVRQTNYTQSPHTYVYPHTKEPKKYYMCKVCYRPVKLYI
jgi:hypothetical protein